MLLGNANVKYDPNLHTTDKNPICLDWGHCFNFDPVTEGRSLSPHPLDFLDAFAQCNRCELPPYYLPG